MLTLLLLLYIYHLWGFYGLAIAYLVKIKVVVVAFFVGSALYLGLRYLWPHRCGGGGEIYKEGPIVLDHSPTFAHHDHVPYSLDHDHYHDHPHFDGSSFISSDPTSFEPYSAYSSNAYSESDGPPESISSDAPTFRRKRSILKESPNKEEAKGSSESLARQMVITEEKIGEFMLGFLGLDTNACRRRFICEMEFKSKRNALTSMAFRVIGRSFFAKYINDQNPISKANSFEECAAVNSECVFIENNEDLEEETAQSSEQEQFNTTSPEQEDFNTNDGKTELPTAESSLESNNIVEKKNEQNLQAELRKNSYRRRFRGDRYLKLI